jgi:RHS repeat-associated protein
MIVESCLSENRVWGSEFENQTFTGAAAWLSSTTRPRCAYRCDGIASVSTVQRYYASSYGRFNTPDIGASARLKNPNSWNRYTYVNGDPVNRRDPHGLVETDCSILANECGSGDDGGSGDSGPIFTVTVTTTGLPDPSPDPCYDAENSIGCAAQVGDGGEGNGANNAGAGGAISAAQQLINAAYGAADRLFSPSCAGLFLSPGQDIAAGIQGLAQTLENLADQGIIRQISSNSLPPNTPANIPAFTSGPGGIIYAVTGGSFFTGTLSGSPLGGVFSGMPLASIQQLMILHEFMHYEGVVGPDRKNQSYTLPNGDVVTGSRGITDEVFKKCF